MRKMHGGIVCHGVYVVGCCHTSIFKWLSREMFIVYQCEGRKSMFVWGGMRGCIPSRVCLGIV
jgi:hypothetical protein